MLLPAVLHQHRTAQHVEKLFTLVRRGYFFAISRWFQVDKERLHVAGRPYAMQREKSMCELAVESWLENVKLPVVYRHCG